MGYWEDNYGDNVDFVNPDDANWQRDPQPPEGVPPIKRVERPESEWDTAKWGKSKFEVGNIVNKTGAKSQFLLTDKELLPLYYKKAYNSMGYKTTKNYDKLKVERTAWEKYGGPTGLKAAKANKKNGVKLLASPSTPRKTKSSTSQAKGAKATMLGSNASPSKGSHKSSSEGSGSCESPIKGLNEFESPSKGNLHSKRQKSFAFIDLT